MSYRARGCKGLPLLILPAAVCPKQREARGLHSPLSAPVEQCGRVATPFSVWLAEDMGAKEGTAARHIPCLLSMFLAPTDPKASITPEPEQ